MIPEDPQLLKAVMQQTPISIENPNAKSSIAFRDLAVTLMNGSNDPVFRKYGMAGFFANIVRGNTR